MLRCIRVSFYRSRLSVCNSGVVQSSRQIFRLTHYCLRTFISSQSLPPSLFTTGTFTFLLELTQRKISHKRFKTLSRILLLFKPRSPLLSALFSNLTTGLWSRSRRLGLETVSRRTNVVVVVLYSHVNQRLVSVSSREKLSTSRSRLGLGHLRLVSKTNFRPNCAGTQCKRALDVVSLCCSYYCLSH